MLVKATFIGTRRAGLGACHLYRQSTVVQVDDLKLESIRQKLFDQYERVTALTAELVKGE